MSIRLDTIPALDGLLVKQYRADDADVMNFKWYNQ